MKKILSLLALLMCGLFVRAAEEPFESGNELIYSSINTMGVEKGLSLYKRKQVIFFRNDTAYVVAVSFSSELDPFWIAKELEHLPVDDQFAYDDHADKIIFSSLGKLYYSYWKEDSWTPHRRVKMEGVNMKVKHATDDKDSHPEFIQKMYNPTFAKGGDRMYFSAVSKGRSDLDLWYSDRGPEDTWLSPHRLTINTDANEEHPFVVGDSLLYFSSNRAENQRANLYYVDLTAKEPVARISVLSNKNSDEIGIVVVDDRAHLISNRRKDRPDRVLDENIFMAQIVFHEKKEAGISFKDIPETVPQENVSAPYEVMPFVFRTMTEAEADAALARGEKLRADRLVALDSIAQAKADSALRVAISTVGENTGANRVTDNVAKTHDKVIFYFDLDDDKLQEKYNADIDAIVQYILSSDDKSKFLIYGFTDERGSDMYNQNLSVRRAQRVFQALCDRGVPSAKLLFTGFGERGLVVKNAKTEAEHQKNRRVEVRKM